MPPVASSCLGDDFTAPRFRIPAPSPFAVCSVPRHSHSFGVGFHLAAFPLLVSTLTTDPLVVATTALASVAPGIVLALPVGGWVDRAHRGRLMVESDLSCAAVLLTLTILVLTGHIHLWMLLGAAALLGSAELVFGVSTYALLPTLVSPADLPRANSLLSVASETGAGILGPALGGISFGLAKYLPFAVNAATYLGSATTIATFVARSDTRAPTPDEPRSTRRRELLAGFTYLHSHRAIRALVVLPATAGFFGWMPEATFVLFIRDHLGIGATGFGVLLGATTGGGVVGGLLTGSLVRRLGTIRTLCVTYLVYGLLLIPVGLIGNPVVLGALFFIQGLPLIASNATVRSLQQQTIPDALLGRVGAVNRLAYSATTPLGQSAGGFLAAWLGYPAVWIIAGTGFLTAFAINLPAIRSLSTTNDRD